MGPPGVPRREVPQAVVVEPGVGGEPGLALIAREGELRGRRVRRRRGARGVRAAEVGREGGRGGEALAAQRAAVRAGQVGAGMWKRRIKFDTGKRRTKLKTGKRMIFLKNHQ